MFKAQSKPTAFTLIELLVVISIIALLISLLIPALGSARSAARNTQCMSGMKSQAMAMHLYAADFKDYAPPHFIARASGTWEGPAGYPSYWDASLSDKILLGQYTKNEKRSNGSQTMYGYFQPGSVWECPDYPKGTGNSKSNYSGSMEIMAQADSSLLWSEMWRIASIKDAAKLIATADSDSFGFSANNGLFYTITDDAANHGSYSFGPNYIRNPRLRHNQRTTFNMSFFDGHVQNFKNPAEDYAAGRLDLSRPQ